MTKVESNELVISLETGDDDFNRLLPEWETLYSAAAISTVYVSPYWAKAWERTLGSTHTPVVITVRRNGKLQALWPFCEVRSLSGTGLWPLGYHTADDAAPLMLTSDQSLLDALKTGLNIALKTYSLIWLPLLKKEFHSNTM